MARGYIGLDAHKEQIVIGIARGQEDPFIHGWWPRNWAICTGSHTHVS